ncbi:MAG TPA: bifunctional (p)ppGpp synthetase/guanosine-3',5'-bis(diphosphate) 3'-pyrophosphohydrolase [Oleiagrimonas sp.]|nr:bifunctional (p)ppGpp synthetase/guanosine-3',5'-bis(diphosphate) 3'-pyrophosphohydrolase [Oleiagrimonas sp.]
MVSRTRPTTANALDTLNAQRDRLAPELVDALDAFVAAEGVDPRECSDILDILQQLGCDAETLASAMWFCVARKAPQTWSSAEAKLSPSLARLVGGQLAAEKVWDLYAQQGRGGEGLRRLLLAIIRDLRVVFVLLARQLARLRHADELPPEQAQALGRLTSDIHAPLANRLGIWQMKWELEDLAFRQLHPDTYKRIARLLDERRTDRERFITQCIDTLRDALADAGIQADLAGRPKHIYSIWKKMQRKHLEFDELYDIRAVRVLVDDLSDCYAALGVVHGLWPHLPHEFDDYIARPKGNGYRSLHTAVIGPHGRTLEVQIRTRDMHRTSELGVAAHWRYKEGGSGDAAFEERIAWMRKLLEARADDDSGLLTDFQTELVEDRVYLLTPKGDVLDLPRGATVLDFAYRVHTEVGHRCRGARVNGRIVPLTFQPRSGDRVEVITGKVSEPSRDWLSPHHSYLNSNRSREKIRAWFRRGQRETNLVVGRQVLERELRRLALDAVDQETLPARLGLKTHDELLEALALGEVGPGQLARAVQAPEPEAPPPTALPSRPPDEPGALKIEGVGNLLTTLARCCQPLPGDDVRGFITRGRGVSVHRADCSGLARLARRDPDRIIDVTWGDTGARAYQVDIGIHGYDRKGLHKDITAVISSAGTPIVASSSRADPKHAEVDLRFTLRVRDYGQLSELMARLSALPNVIDVQRLAA